MSVGKEIRTKIKSVKSTQKITKAMEMVAASKMRKTQDRMQASRPYATRIKQVIKHLSTGSLEYEHPYLVTREVKRVGYMLVSTDRGLCGGLNINLFKTLLYEMKAYEEKGVDVDICALGKKGENFFRTFGGRVVAAVPHLGDDPLVHTLVGAVKVMLDAYNEGKIDKIYLVYNRFLNTMTQEPTVEQLVPIQDSEEESTRTSWDYLYEPNPEDLLGALLQRYIESLVYQAMVENVACEQAARMVAMKSASDNAGELIDDLQLVFNKARQAAITQELSEIVAGAAAV